VKHFTKTAVFLSAILLLILSACGGQAQSTQNTSAAYTQIAVTALYMQTQTAQAASLTPSITNTPQVSPTPEASNTPLLTDTPLPGTPSVTPLSLSSPTSILSQQDSCDNAAYVADVNFPDGSEVFPGGPFTKTWRVKNTGPCTWDKSYRLAFGWGGVGTNWNTVAPVALIVSVLPGQTYEVSVTLTAPTQPGNYDAAFRLQNSKGFFFGDTLTVVVKVK